TLSISLRISCITCYKSDVTSYSTIITGNIADGFINALVLQPDRKIVIGGGFTMYDDHPHSHIARIHGGTVVGPGSLTFSHGEFQVSESGGSALIMVKRKGGTTGTVGVNFTTADGTAVDSQDYIGTNGSLTFPDGETIRGFRVQIIDNTITNEDRFLNL